ncbi:hypothetical protein QVD99_006432 [Batrachochytrium dendrobatidis]|nr:hypothetical protein QVD99_006432 [Batrachochytrium dendrobatidis]
MLVSTGSNGSPEASGLIAGFSSNIYKRGQENPFDKDHSDTDSDQEAASGENSELIRQLKIQVEDAGKAESIAANTLLKYTNLGFKQKKLIAQGKTISGEKYSEQRENQLDEEWKAQRGKLDILRQKLREARLGTSGRDRKHSIDESDSSTSSRDRKHSIDKPGPSTPSRDRKHSIDEPGPSTSGRDRKHSIVRHHSDTDSDQGITSGKNSELIRRLEREVEDAENAEAIASSNLFKYTNLGVQQKGLIAQGKTISGEKYSEQRENQLDEEWKAQRGKLDILRQKLREARLGTSGRDRKHSIDESDSSTSGQDRKHSIDKPDPSTPSRDRKHSIDEPGPSTSGRDRKHSIDKPDPSTPNRDRKHSIDEPSPCTIQQSRKLPSDKEQPRENRELIHQLVQKLEAADTASTAACEASYAYRIIEYEQERLISQGKPISGERHIRIRQYKLDSQWQAARRKVEHLEQKLQQARSAIPKQTRKHSIDKPDPSTSKQGRKHSIVRHHSDTDSDQGIAPAKKHRPTHQLDINLENAERARAAACNSYYEYKATRLEQKKLKSNGQKISGKKYSSRTEHELKEKCRKASKAKHYMIRQLEGTNGNTPSRSRKHSVVRHHSDTDSDQETLSRKKYRKLVRKLKRKIKEYKSRRKGACKKYRKHQFFVSKQWSRLAKGKSVSKSFYSLKGEEKWKRRCERQGRRVEYLEQKLRELMGEP